jgi:hypothetical protein
MQLAPFEEKMWKSLPPNTPEHRRFDRDTYQRYDFKETPIVTEINREKLPRFVESLKLSNYIEMRSFYQRRGNWTATMKSRLIESFILNIPVPSIILYKQDFKPYEVLDGEQRISAIQEFYENKLKLTESIKLNKISHNHVEITSEEEVGLKFDRDARIGLTIYVTSSYRVD